MKTNSLTRFQTMSDNYYSYYCCCCCDVAGDVDFDYYKSTFALVVGISFPHLLAVVVAVPAAVEVVVVVAGYVLFLLLLLM